MTIYNNGLLNSEVKENYCLLEEGLDKMTFPDVGNITGRVIHGPNNSHIKLGRDMPGDRGTGYGSMPVGTGGGDCGTVDICVGLGGQGRGKIPHLTEKGGQRYISPMFRPDWTAARLYLSAKSDPDLYLGLTTNNDNFHPRKGVSSILGIADEIRLGSVGRIKLVSGYTRKSSNCVTPDTGVTDLQAQMARVMNDYGVDIQSSDSDEGLEPILKGYETLEMMKLLLGYTSVEGPLMKLIKMVQLLATRLATHVHVGNLAQPTMVPIESATALPKDLVDMFTEMTIPLTTLRAKREAFSLAYLGKNSSVLSKFNRVD